MRFLNFAAFSLLLAGCGHQGPKPAANGPGLSASLTASWPTTMPPRQAVFSPDGRHAALSDASGAIEIRDTRSWKVIARLNHPGGATSLAFDRSGMRLFSGGYDGMVREWDLSRHSQVSAIKASGAAVWTIDLSPDGKRIATGGEDKIIRIWNLDNRTAAPVQLPGHTRNIWEVRFSPDGKRLASCSFDYSVRLWDAERGRALKTLSGHKQSCVGLNYSPDGSLIASGGDDAAIRYWRASDGAALRTVDNGHHVDKVVFSSDGRWLASGGHPHGLIGDAWHYLTGGGGDGDAVRLWRVSDGALVAGLPHPDAVYFVVFSPDGRWLVTSGEDNRVRLWRLTPRG